MCTLVHQQSILRFTKKVKKICKNIPSSWLQCWLCLHCAWRERSGGRQSCLGLSYLSITLAIILSREPEWDNLILGYVFRKIWIPRIRSQFLLYWWYKKQAQQVNVWTCFVLDSSSHNKFHLLARIDYRLMGLSISDNHNKCRHCFHCIWLHQHHDNIDALIL